MTIGTRLRQLRKANKLSGDKLGEMCGVSKGMVSQWESDTSTPPTERLIELQKHIKFSIDWLLTGSGGDDGTPGADHAVREFAWVFHNANEAGRAMLRDAVNLACKIYVETERRHQRVSVVSERRERK